MALYRVREGVRTLLDDLSDGASDLVGIGQPGGDAGNQDAASIGSTYAQIDAAASSLQLWIKTSVASSDNTDWMQAVDTGHLELVVGDRVYAANNFVTDGQSVTDSIESLDVAIAALSGGMVTKTPAVTAATVVGSVVVADVDVVTWRVSAVEVANPANRITGLVTATHDGAGLTDFSFHDVVTTGVNIDGLTVDVAVVGANMDLTMSLTDSSDLSVKVLITDTYQ